MRSSTTARWKLAIEIERGAARKRAEGVGGAFAAGEGLLAGVDFGLQLGMAAEMVEHGGLDAAEAEIVGIAFHFWLAEADGFGIAVRGELVDDRAAGIAESEHAGDFVVGFAGGVVARAADAGVVKIWRGSRRHSMRSDVTW